MPFQEVNGLQRCFRAKPPWSDDLVDREPPRQVGVTEGEPSNKAGDTQPQAFGGGQAAEDIWAYGGQVRVDAEASRERQGMSFAGQNDVVVPLHRLAGGRMAQHQGALTDAGAGGKKDGPLAARQAGCVHERVTALKELQAEQGLDVEGLKE